MKLKTVPLVKDGVPYYRAKIDYYEDQSLSFVIGTNHIDEWKKSMMNENVKRFVIEPIKVEVKDEN